MNSLRTLLAPLGAALAANPTLVLTVVSTVLGWLMLNVVNRRMPVGHPAWWAVLLDRIVATTQRGAANRWSWPVFGKSLVRAVARGALDTLGPDDAPGGGARSNPRGEGGFAWGRLPLLFAVALPLLALHLTRCSSTQVHQQAVAATALSGAANRAVPLLLDAYHHDVDAAVAQGRVQFNATRSRWVPVWSAWEAARLAHDQWAGALMACQSDAQDPRCAQLPTAEAAALDALLGWRCSVRGLGRPDLDPLPAALPLACDAPDGGAPDGH